MAEKTAKGRYWTYVVYPESLPSNWKDILQQTGLPFCISPLHDKDINEAAEGGPAPKKAHYHLIGAWTNPTTESVATSLAKQLNGPNPKLLRSVKGAYRYLTHKDNPEKAQYNEKDITFINGFSIEDYAASTKGEVHAMYSQLIVIIKEQDFEDLDALYDYLADNGLTELTLFLEFNTYFIDKYLNSRYKRKRKARNDRLRELQLRQLERAEEREASFQEREAAFNQRYNVDDSTGEVVTEDDEI